VKPVEGGYRCAECGNGEKLWAWAGANVYGPLAADGSELMEHEAVEEWGIHEDSIQCTEHPGAVIEMFNRGKWCRWWFCPKCGGRGRVAVGEHWKAPDGYECPAKTPWGKRYTHEGWLPVEEHPAA
jgi:hypothetical protein